MKKTNIRQFAIVLLTLVVISCNNNTEPAKTAIDTTAADTTTKATPATTTTASARPVHWGYEGATGPANWGTLTAVYSACGTGKGQSPIDIVTSSTGGSAQIEFKYGPSNLKLAHNEHVDDIIDNGHTIQGTLEEGNSITIGGKSYDLRQFHFHTPSEHTIDGKHLPMEMHMVHQAADKSFAVLSLMFTEGKANENIAKVIANLPARKGDTTILPNKQLDVSLHIPKDASAYHYIGSFTTPPCTENVEWLILRHKATVSKDQVQAMASRIGNNNRPVQASNDRPISVNKIASK